jgi:hypothetical protein
MNLVYLLAFSFALPPLRSPTKTLSLFPKSFSLFFSRTKNGNNYHFNNSFSILCSSSYSFFLAFLRAPLLVCFFALFLVPPHLCSLLFSISSPFSSLFLVLYIIFSSLFFISSLCSRLSFFGALFIPLLALFLDLLLSLLFHLLYVLSPFFFPYPSSCSSPFLLLSLFFVFSLCSFFTSLCLQEAVAVTIYFSFCDVSFVFLLSINVSLYSPCYPCTVTCR